LTTHPIWDPRVLYSRKLNLTPESLLKNLEFSEPLAKHYTWDDLVNTLKTFESDGWRLPKKWELMLLYEETVESRNNHFYWADESVHGNNDTRLGIWFNTGNTEYQDRNTKGRVRLVRNRLDIRPEFKVSSLEYSETLPDRYCWDILADLKWPNKWRLPTDEELLALYKQEPTSRNSIIYWSSSYPNKCEAWCISFKDADIRGRDRALHYSVRLVRERNP
jgi:hypothetical protein